MLNKTDIQRLATLSKLELKNDEVDYYTQEMTKIIQFVEELQSVDTEGVIPTFHGNTLQNVYRNDESVVSHLNEAMLNNAPDQKDGFIRVPVIIESEGSNA